MIRSAGFVLLLSALFPAVALAYGEADGERYTLEERAMHFYTDRLRVDPGFSDPESDHIDPMAPLVYNPDLNDAARFYAEDMELNGCFPADHSSCDGTSFDERVGGFYQGQLIGENIAMGGLTPEAVVWDAWLYSPGHRANMLNPSYEELGPGYAGTPWSNSWWVQDFGSRGGTPIPLVTSATHNPLWPNPGQAMELYASVHDAAGMPTQVEVMVDGICYPMDHDRGFDGSRTYAATVQTGTQACLQYLIVVTTIDGDEFTYPDEGSLLVSVDEADCEAWTADRSAAECLPQANGSGFGGTGTGCGGSASPDENVGDNAEYGTCSVSHAPRRNSMLLLLALAGVARRRAAR